MSVEHWRENPDRRNPSSGSRRDGRTHTHRHDEALRARKPDLGGPHPVPHSRITRAYILGSNVASAGRSQTDII